MSNHPYVGFHTTEFEDPDDVLPHGMTTSERVRVGRLRWFIARESLQRISHDLCDDCWCITCREVRRIRKKYA